MLADRLFVGPELAIVAGTGKAAALWLAVAVVASTAELVGPVVVAAGPVVVPAVDLPGAGPEALVALVVAAAVAGLATAGGLASVAMGFAGAGLSAAAEMALQAARASEPEPAVLGVVVLAGRVVAVASWEGQVALLGVPFRHPK